MNPKPFPDEPGWSQNDQEKSTLKLLTLISKHGLINWTTSHFGLGGRLTSSSDNSNQCYIIYSLYQLNPFQNQPGWTQNDQEKHTQVTQSMVWSTEQTYQFALGGRHQTTTVTNAILSACVAYPSQSWLMISRIIWPINHNYYSTWKLCIICGL